MDRSQVVDGVAKELYATEHALDAAITQATTLVQSLIGARSMLSVSPVAFAASQTKAMEVIAALSTAREAVVASHAEMQKDHRRMGWGTYAAVGPIDKPEEWDTRPIQPKRAPEHLRVA
jgi:hypothetical protein